MVKGSGRMILSGNNSGVQNVGSMRMDLLISRSSEWLDQGWFVVGVIISGLFQTRGLLETSGLLRGLFQR